MYIKYLPFLRPSVLSENVMAVTEWRTYMAKWIEIRKSGDFAEWGRALGIDPLCARVIRNRGVESIEEARKYLDGGEELLHDPFLLPDMDNAVDGLLRHLDEGSKIRIIGDYDVDGVTASYILVTCIRAAGGDVSYAIPHRMKDGYGINNEMVRDASDDGVKLIITCDNGISASEQVAYAYELGLEVIVTDHHQVPSVVASDGSKSEILPECIAVVDPHRNGSEYPFKGICGAMVAYKFMIALEKRRSSDALIRAIHNARQFAALGTVCDVMELKDENRAVVSLGLEDMKHTENAGLKALMEANNLSETGLSTYSMGFVIGPSINSTGRLESASESLGLLLSDDRSECLRAAVRIRELNDERKDMTAAGFDAAVSLIEENDLLKNKILIVYLPDTHESIAGLIAGRLKERFYRPVLVITKGEEGLKGSGRSVPAYNMFEKFSEVKELFTKMGGHAMAAGFSLEEENLQLLGDKLNENAGLTDEDLEKTVMIDARVPLEYASVSLIRDLQRIEPVGTGNSGALFAQQDAEIVAVNRMGKEKKFGSLTVLSGKRNFRVTCFEDMDVFDDYVANKYGREKLDALYEKRGSVRLHICYELKINEYQGNENVDYRLKYYM